MPSTNRSWINQRSKNAGNEHQYVPKNGTAAKIAANAAGRKTTRAPKIVCVNHINKPWNSANFALAIKTLDTDVSMASAMRGPDENPK